MSRETSIAAYREIKDKGLIGEVQFRVYDELFNVGPSTQGEIAHRLHMDRNVASPRFAELKALGLIREKDKRPCAITGHVCIVWETTENLPAAKPEPRGARKILTELLARVGELERTVKDMKEARFDRDGQGSLFGNTTYKGH